MEKEWKSEWKQNGYCDAHRGQGTNLNKVHESGLVAKHYNLPTNSWVCQDCWNRYDS